MKKANKDELQIVHKFINEDHFAKAERLRNLGFKVEPCCETNCQKCVPDTVENRLKLAALLRKS